MTNLVIVREKENVERLVQYVTRTFGIDVNVEKTPSGSYLLVSSTKSEYIIGLLDGMVSQFKYPILVNEKE